MLTKMPLFHLAFPSLLPLFDGITFVTHAFTCSITYLMRESDVTPSNIKETTNNVVKTSYRDGSFNHISPPSAFAAK